MNRPLSNAVDVMPFQTKPWTVLIQVLEKGRLQESYKNKTDFRRLLFTDCQGTKLTALIFSTNLHYFANMFSPYKRYYISNAEVKTIEPKYRISSYPYSWVLSTRTPIEELIESVPSPLPCRFEFTNFGDLHKHADTETSLNVKAVVLRCFPTTNQGPENATKKDIIIVNEQNKLMILTLWNDFAEAEGRALHSIIESAPMIFGMRLKVTTYNGLSLSTRSTSALMINPPVNEDLQMHEWYENNKEGLQQLLAMETYKNPNLLLPYPDDEDIISIATALERLKISKTPWIKGKIFLPYQERSYWFTACANCHKAINADMTWIVKCPSCKKESEIHAISRLSLIVNDGTGSIETTISAPDVDKFIPFTGIQLKEAEEKGIDVYEEIADSISQVTIVAFVRSYEVTYHKESEMKVNIVTAYKHDDPHNSQPTDQTTDKGNQPHIPSTSANRQGKHPTSATKEVIEQAIVESPSKKTKKSNT